MCFVVEVFSVEKFFLLILFNLSAVSFHLVTFGVTSTDFHID